MKKKIFLFTVKITQIWKSHTIRLSKFQKNSESVLEKNLHCNYSDIYSQNGITSVVHLFEEGN